MLRYLQDSRPENVRDDATRELHHYVTNVKQLPEVKEAYMRFEEIVYYERQDAAEKAAKEAAEAARRQDILELLEEYGTVPDFVRQRLEAEEDAGRLSQWLKFAAKAGSMENFIEQMR